MRPEQHSAGPATFAHPDRATQAGIYDALSGGGHNFAADRDAASRLRAAVPDIERLARANRAFVHRAVRRLVRLGVTQFLDLGCGLPMTQGSVLHTARVYNSAVRVVYVDRDDTVVSFLRHVLDQTNGVSVLHADLRDVNAVLASAEVLDCLDLGRPVAVLACGVLHFVPDSDDPAGIVAGYGEALAPGSYVVISHATPCGLSGQQQAAVSAIYAETASPLRLRNPQEISALIPPAYTLLSPGLHSPEALVPVGDWQPMDDLSAPEQAGCLYGGVAYRCPEYP